MERSLLSLCYYNKINTPTMYEVLGKDTMADCGLALVS